MAATVLDTRVQFNVVSGMVVGRRHTNVCTLVHDCLKLKPDFIGTLLTLYGAFLLASDERS